VVLLLLLLASVWRHAGCWVLAWHHQY